MESKLGTTFFLVSLIHDAITKEIGELHNSQYNYLLLLNTGSSYIASFDTIRDDIAEGFSKHRDEYPNSFEAKLPEDAITGAIDLLINNAKLIIDKETNEIYERFM